MISTKGSKILHHNSDLEWEKFGKTDPYYGVLVSDKFRRSKLNKNSINEFFKSGQDHINYIVETIHGSVDPEFSPASALDFGCGVGRCTFPLTEFCKRVVGSDVSDSMLSEAIKNIGDNSIENLEFVRSDDTLSGISGTFDFIHSFSVFMHIPPKRGYKIFERLIGLLSNNGIAAIEFIYFRQKNFLNATIGKMRRNVPLLNNFFNLLVKRPFSEPLMEKNVYDLNKLLLIIREKGCGNVHVRFFDSGNHRLILFFQKRQDMVPLLKVLSGNDTS